MTAFNAVRGLSLDLNFRIHGLPATVTPAGSPAITTRVIWLPTEGDGLTGGGIEKISPIRVAVLRKDEVPSIPVRVGGVHSTISAPERPGIAATTWKVTGYDGQRADVHRVTVEPA